MDFVVIHKNEWSFQINIERPGERCSVQTAERATITPELGDSSACAGAWKGLPQWIQGELEGWLHTEAGCAPVGSSPHLRFSRFWVCTAVTETRFSPSEFCIIMVHKSPWLWVLRDQNEVLNLLFLPVWNCSLSACFLLPFQKGILGVISSWPNCSHSLDPLHSEKNSVILLWLRICKQ